MPISRNNASMPNVRASSGMIGTMRLPIFLLRSSAVTNRTNAIVVDASIAPEPLKNSPNSRFGGIVKLWRRDFARGQKTAKRFAAFEQIFRLRAVGGRTIKRRLGDRPRR